MVASRSSSVSGWEMQSEFRTNKLVSAIRMNSVKAREAKDVNPNNRKPPVSIKTVTVEDNASPTEKPRTLAAVVIESKLPERMLRKAQGLKKNNPEVYERVRAGTISLRDAVKPKPKPAAVRFAEKDYFARIGRGLAAAFSGVDARLKELIAIKKSEWTPQAEEGVRCLILNLRDVSDKADAYANQLRGVLERNA